MRGGTMSNGKSKRPAQSKALSSFEIANTLQRALALHQRGHLAQAEPLYRSILGEAPNHFDALHLLGVLEHQRGDDTAALQLIGRALKLNPKSAAAHANKGVVLRDLQRHVEALVSFDRALALKPDQAEAQINRGMVLRHLKRHEEALAGYGRALALKPNSVEALNNRGIVFSDLKRHEEALASFDYALALRPDYAEALNNRGMALRDLKRHEEALSAFDRVLAIKPDYAEAQNNRGTALSHLERHEEALDSYDRALAIRPDYADALSNRGDALRGLNRLEEAIASYDLALAIRPDHVEALNNRGNALRDLKRLDEAEVAFRHAVALAPDRVGYLENLGIVLQELERFEEAASCLRRALALDPGNDNILVSLASTLVDLRDMRGARDMCERALSLRPDNPDALNVMGRIAYETHALDDAAAYCRRALELKPDLALAWHTIGLVSLDLGRVGEARDALLKAHDLDPKQTAILNNLVNVAKIAIDDPIVATMEGLLQDGIHLPNSERVNLQFALGKACADIGDHARSFEHFSRGNALNRRRIAYDEAAAMQHFAAVEEVFTAEFLHSKAGSGDPSRLPVFVLGMPRSGTTLVEQILASHPAIHGAGELNLLYETVVDRPGAYPDAVHKFDRTKFRALGERYLARLRSLAPESELITDKLPSNFIFVGLIYLTLPNAVVIHTMRDPVDTCYSCFTKLFRGLQGFAYDLGELGRFYRKYQGLMEHWRRVLPAGWMLDVQYEDVVADIETQARRIIAHCGLEWDPACLSFHETQRPVHTASLVQVRQPIYRTSLGRARPYDEFLGPLRAALTS
jgi:tetratricopeptide (TPR) repeat protein